MSISFLAPLGILATLWSKLTMNLFPAHGSGSGSRIGLGPRARVRVRVRVRARIRARVRVRARAFGIGFGARIRARVRVRIRARVRVRVLGFRLGFGFGRGIRLWLQSGALRHFAIAACRELAPAQAHGHRNCQHHQCHTQYCPGTSTELPALVNEAELTYQSTSEAGSAFAHGHDTGLSALGPQAYRTIRLALVDVSTLKRLGRERHRGDPEVAGTTNAPRY